MKDDTVSIVDALKRSIVFKEWEEAALEDVASRFRLVPVPAGGVLCREGDDGEHMYVVGSGRFSVETLVAGRAVHVADLGTSAVIGEMALLSGTPRTATVTAEVDGHVWALDQTTFQDVLRTHPELGVRIARLMSSRQTENERLQPQNEKVSLASFSEAKDVVTIGRNADNDIVLADPQVSRIHCLIERSGSTYHVIDLNTEIGTYVNGVRVRSSPIQDGDTIRIGVNEVLFDRAALMSFSRGRGVKVDAVSLSNDIGHGHINLHDVSLSVYPGELVAIVGASGAGKTTLLNSLNGFRPATSGRVLYNGVDYYRHFDLYRKFLGYVPQDDIVHQELTVYETLHYAARLRLPRDTSTDEIEERVGEVLRELELGAHRGTVVGRLSGGQRKRVSIAVELLTRPGVFYLDEPTSGLDPALDGRMMTLFRQLAGQDRTILLTTHATKHLMMCDKVVFLARGGYLAFFGTPTQALAYFAVSDVVDIYDHLESEADPATWAARFVASPLYEGFVRLRLQDTQPPARPPAPEGRMRAQLRTLTDSLRQLVWLSARYVNVLRHDPAVLALLLLQAPIIAATLAITFPRGIFALSARNGGDAREVLVLLFTLAVASVWLGANNGASAITDEAAIYLRERLINLRAVPYVVSKVWILGLFSVIQSVLLVGVTAIAISFPGGWHTLICVFAVITLTNITGLGLGLFASSLSRNSLQSTAVVVTLLIPQLILAGSSVPIRDVPFIGKIMSLLMLSRWSLSLLGYDTGVNDRLNSQLIPGTTNHYAAQFSISPWGYALILFGFFTVFLVGTMVAQTRKGAR